MHSYKIGFVDEYLLAKEIHQSGLKSCAEVDAANWFLTSDPETRTRIDAWLRLLERHKDCCLQGSIQCLKGERA